MPDSDGGGGGAAENPAAAIGALLAAEREFLSGLRSRPDDTGTRLNLAWCLGMQSLFAAGREYAGGGGPPCPDARALLLRCLRHAAIVYQLSANPGEQRRVAELHDLVRMSSGEEALREAGEEVCRITRGLAEAVASAHPDAPPPAARRRV